MTYVFKEGDKVNCPWCGEEIILTPGVVSRFMHPIDNNPFVICPNESCEHITSGVFLRRWEQDQGSAAGMPSS